MADWVMSVFVFGSNTDGVHGKGAALVARERHGAIQGHAEGLQGRAYAIPTKGGRLGSHLPFPVLTRDEIAVGVDRFLDFTVRRPEWRFNVTQIGCGLAGYKPSDIAPMFEDALQLHNVFLPESFVKALGWLHDSSLTSFDDQDRLVNP